MGRLEETEGELRRQPKTWLVTGAAGFIGSNLVQRLLELGQSVVGLDNFATGHRRNVAELRPLTPTLSQGERGFRFFEGDVRDLETCRKVCTGVDFVLHQAALGSVPRSIKDPLSTHQVNVDGTVNMLLAARDAKVRRFVFASSSSVYGDHPALPKVEDQLGRPLSPYAVSKLVDEVYARVFNDSYGLSTIGLRYFNVFGRRQDPEGPYAAVIPRWIASLLHGERCTLFGDGETSRDFCFVDNVVQANLLAATAPAEASNQVFNIACGARTTLKELHQLIATRLEVTLQPDFQPFRPGDIRHSLADISKAQRLLGYQARFSVAQGLDATMDWYVAQARSGGR